MSVADRRRGSAGLRGELDPNIMPRHMRALEEVATRLLDERPAPDPAFRAQLDGRMRELGAGIRGGIPSYWRLGAAVCLLLGLALLIAAVILALQLGSG
jgi:hypothetical protein